MQHPFTVKIQEFNGGETVFPAYCVEALPDKEDQAASSRQPVKKVLIHQSNTEPPEEVFSGSVYVMNSEGNTVARYRIDDADASY